MRRSIRRFVETRLAGTALHEWGWRLRHLWRRGSYMNSLDHPHRELLVERILNHVPVASALEIGNNCGPNLVRLAERLPEAAITGVDISAAAVAEGRREMERGGLENVSLEVRRADRLDAFADGSVDVVFSDASCIYIGPDKIDDVLAEMVRIAAKAVVLCEWHTDTGESAWADAHWAHDYRRRFAGLAPAREASVERIEGDLWGDAYWREFGSFIEVAL